MTSFPADSLTGRLLAGVGGRLGLVWRTSRTGAAVRWLRVFIVALVSGSLLLSLSSAGSRPLAETASPRTRSRLFAGLAALYVWVGCRLGGGGPGRSVRRLARSASYSVLLTRQGERLLAVGVLGLAGGRLLHLVRTSGPPVLAAVWIGVAVLAVMALSAGPRLRTAVRGSAPSRAFALLAGTTGESAAVGRPAVDRFPLSSVALGLAALAGFLAGGGGGRAWLVVPVAGVVVVAVLGALVRPELTLLPLAAFPWVDYAFGLAVGARAAVLDALLLLGSLFALLVAVVLTRRWDLRSVPLTLPLLTAFVLAVASITLTNVQPPVAVFALRLTFQAFLFYLLGYLLPKDRVWVGRTVGVFLLSAALLALHGLVQVATHAPMPAKWVDVHEDIGTRAYSIVQNPNGLGAFLALAALLGLSLTLARLPRGQRLAAGVLTVVLLAGLAATFSRGAWIGFGLGLLVLVALTQARLFWAIVVAAVASPLLLPTALVDRLTFAFSSAYLAKSATAGRLYIWNVALQRIGEHPLVGVGLGTFGGTSAFLYASGRLWVDNYYLQLAAEGGLLLLAAFFWVLVRAAKGLLLSYRRQSDPYQRAVAAGVLAGFVAVAVANVTASVWETLVVAAGFWFLTGFAAALDPDRGPLPPLSELTDEPQR